ncbi:MAG TPA: helix-turn-helix transcriptional regulator, partial [Umezawaea sp.]|nr:helix-turn-helix transcriptional regulator [Umezawaea sp.]
MGKNAEPTFRQRKLGEALRVLRERAGLTQQEAAHRLRYDNRKLSRIENGQRPEYHGLRAMLDEYGLAVSEWQPYLDMYERAIEKGWWHPYGLDDHGYISLEHDACMVRSFQPGYVPGLLQTENYIRQVFAGARVQRSKRWIDNQVLVRLRRQERLLGAEPLRFHAIIAESALCQAERLQLLHINERGLLDPIEVQVLLNSVGLHDGYNGAFTLLDFPDKRDSRVLYVEHAIGSVHVEDPEKVKASRLVFTHLSKLALTSQESAAWIGGLAAER